MGAERRCVGSPRGVEGWEERGDVAEAGANRPVKFNDGNWRVAPAAELMSCDTSEPIISEPICDL